jgi:hypothetical protein
MRLRSIGPADPACYTLAGPKASYSTMVGGSAKV